jgi:hypothetical protein
MEAELAEVATAKAEAERRLAQEEESRLAEVTFYQVKVGLIWMLSGGREVASRGSASGGGQAAHRP